MKIQCEEVFKEERIKMKKGKGEYRKWLCGTTKKKLFIFLIFLQEIQVLLRLKKKKIGNLLTSFNIFQLLNNKFINSSKLTIIISF